MFLGLKLENLVTLKIFETIIFQAFRLQISQNFSNKFNQDYKTSLLRIRRHYFNLEMASYINDSLLYLSVSVEAERKEENWKMICC